MEESIKEVLMRRDELSEEEAQEWVDSAKEEVREIVECGGGLFDVEEVVEREFGLEPDYVMELL